MSDEVIDTTENYLKAAEAADEVDFFQQYGLDTVETLHSKLRAAYIRGYMDALRVPTTPEPK